MSLRDKEGTFDLGVLELFDAETGDLVLDDFLWGEQGIDVGQV